MDYYLIGAIARQIWYEKAQIRFRTTKDVDYAVFVGSYEEYDTVKNYLIEQEGYSSVKENEIVLISPDGLTVDLLPFGEIEIGRNVQITGVGMTSIRADGMMEVYQHGTEVISLETGNSFKAATLTGIVVLKLIAYDDRPEMRQKDASDIGNILTHFFDLHQALIYDVHLDLFGEEERTLENISAIVLGREIFKIVSTNQDLIQRLYRILTDHIASGATNPFIQQIAKETKQNIGMVIGYLSDILWGFHNPSFSE